MPVARPAVGWREWVGLPGLGIDSIKAKVDTGARTSALHAVRVRRKKIDGSDMVCFDVHPLQKSTTPLVACQSPLLDERYVRSSDGTRELRPVIQTVVQLGDLTWPIELTLTNRALMGFRLLLGRRALSKKFVVDPSRSWLRSGRH
jgi:hypothetical protein